MTEQAPDPLPLYRSLQREVREAIDRCADGLGQKVVTCPSTPDDPETTLENVVRAALRADPGGLLQRLLMVLAESARNGDAVAQFVIERIAVGYAAHELQTMYDMGLVSELQLGVSGHAA